MGNCSRFGVAAREYILAKWQRKVERDQAVKALNARTRSLDVIVRL